MSLKEGIYTFKVLPKNVQPPVFGGMYATAVDKHMPIIAAAQTPQFSAKQNWHVIPVDNKSDTYIVALHNSLPETVYMNTKFDTTMSNETVILSGTPKEWYIGKSILPGGGYGINAPTTLVGASHCVGVSEDEELIIQNFAVIPSSFGNTPLWDFNFQGPIVPLEPGIVLPRPTLVEWVTQMITEIYQAESAGMVSAVIENFIAPDARITHNGIKMSRAQYAEHFRGEVPAEISATAKILGMVAVPTDPHNPNDAGTVGGLYNASIGSAHLFSGHPGMFTSTSSLVVVVKQAHVNSVDHRRVFELIQVTNTKLFNPSPVPPITK